MSLIFKHLRVYSQNETQEKWYNKLIKKHFDIPEWNGQEYRSCGETALTIGGQHVIKNGGYTSVFACCGLAQLEGYGTVRYIGLPLEPKKQYRKEFDLVPFWKEFWPMYRLRRTVPTLLVVAELVGQGYVYGELDKILVENSVHLKSFRNVRYENHILHLRMMYHPEGTEHFLNDALKALPAVTFPESFAP